MSASIHRIQPAVFAAMDLTARVKPGLSISF